MLLSEIALVGKCLYVFRMIVGITTLPIISLNSLNQVLK